MRPFWQGWMRPDKEILAVFLRPMRRRFAALSKRLRSLCKGAFKGFAKRIPLALPFFKATDHLQRRSENGHLARDKVSNLSNIGNCKEI